MRRSTERVLLAVLVLVAGTYAVAEEIILSTYYPSPRGVYDSLRSEELYVRGGNSYWDGVGPTVASDALAALRCADGADENWPRDAVNAPKCARVDISGDGRVTRVEADILLRRAVGLIGNDDDMHYYARYLSNSGITARWKPGETFSAELLPGASFSMPPLVPASGPQPPAAAGCEAYTDATCICPPGMTWSNLDGNINIDVNECGFPSLHVNGLSGLVTIRGTLDVNDVSVRSPGTVAGSVFNVTTVRSAVAAVNAVGATVTATCPATRIRIGCSESMTDAAGVMRLVTPGFVAIASGAEPTGVALGGGCQSRFWSTNGVVYAYCMGP